jgi:formylglycine-generating enzyme required for sulfatase activity
VKPNIPKNVGLHSPTYNFNKDEKMLQHLRKRKITIVVALTLTAFLGVAGHVYAESKRVALVIGNSDYTTAPLVNPVNDARDVSAALKQYGFSVITKLNADQRTMEEAMDELYRQLRQAEVALFYYAGHGMQIEGHNYLVPVGAKVANAKDVKYEAVDAGKVLGKMEDGGSKTNIVILDACRNNPFRSLFRSSNPGLAFMDAPSGTIISYATGLNSIAADGKGRNGLYTEHLLKNMARQDLSVLQLFNRTALDVKRLTQGAQQPFIYFNGLEPIYLAGGNPDQVVSEAPANLREDKSAGSLKVTSTQNGAQETVDGKAEETQPASEKTFTDSTTGMEFVAVPGGCFQMGDTFGDGDSDEKPVHEVCVDSFFLGKYEVTQEEYQKVVGTNPSEFKQGSRYPVETVSWNDAQEFIKKLNSRSKRQYRLPTEAEWEYAARSGGKKEEYAGSNDVDVVAWYEANSGRITHPVGGKRPNGLGIYDMSGNVWEWTGDRYGKDYFGKDYYGNRPSSDSVRVLRGGGWGNGSASARAAYRDGDQPWERYGSLGFRIVLAPRIADR